MEYGFDLDFDQMPSNVLSLLPLDAWSVEYEMPVEDLLFEMVLEFDVEEDRYEDEYSSMTMETVVHQELTCNGVKVPAEFWEGLLPSEVNREILLLGPGEFLDY